MQMRTQYMLFLVLWAGALVAAFVVALAYGFDVGENFRGALILFAILALVPAAVGYVLLQRMGSLVDRWRVKRGHDVYRERAYEDDAGFIHLNEVPECEKQEEIRLSEIVSGMEPMLEHTLRKSDDS